MSDSVETLDKEPTLKDILNAINKLSERMDAHDVQFEAIRTGIIHNNIAFDRLQSTVFSMRANLTEISEEIKHSQKVLT